ncbi:MAG: BA14K family protein [Xanthobacteraceae bacterium]
MRPIASGGWRGHHGHHGWHGRYRRGGFYPGLAAGALIGGAFAAPYAYGYGYPYYYDDDYYYDAPTVAVAADPGSVAYCQRRFKSYDVRTGTYLGYDGLRHPCP